MSAFARSQPAGLSQERRLSARFGALALALAGVLACGPAASTAEELGRIEALLGGETLDWRTITTDRTSGTIASASIRFGPRLTELHVQGHPEAQFTTHDVFSVDIRFLGAYTPGLSPMAVDILYMPQGMGGPFWTSGGASTGPVVRVLALEAWGGVGRVDALFAGELCRKQKITTATDPAVCREVTGRIETELFVEYGASRAASSGPAVVRPPPGEDRTE